jgi:hypothetical protein
MNFLGSKSLKGIPFQKHSYIEIQKAKNKFLGLVSTFDTFAAGGFILVVGILVRQAAESLVLYSVLYNVLLRIREKRMIMKLDALKADPES